MGFFGHKSNISKFQPLVNAAKELKDDPSKEISANVDIKKFIDAVGPGYYTYDGSLTTPTCNEVVSWYVMEGTIAISQEQVIQRITVQNGA